MTLAIQGDWGSGKTTAMEYIANQLGATNTDNTDKKTKAKNSDSNEELDDNNDIIVKFNSRAEDSPAYAPLRGGRILSATVEPGQCMIYMSIGSHAGEDLDTIVRRKQEEIGNAGYAFWGYGGVLGTPTGGPMQEFLSKVKESANPAYVCMYPTKSVFSGTSDRATEYSIDGEHWETIPTTINCTGADHALVLSEISVVDETVPLGQFVCVGGIWDGHHPTQDAVINGEPKRACFTEEGRPRSQADKLRLVNVGGDTEPEVPIIIRATLAEPYAVFVR